MTNRARLYKMGIAGLLLALAFILQHSSFILSARADPPATTAVPVTATTGTAGFAVTSGSAAQSGTAGYARVSGSAAQSGTAGYATVSGSAAQSGMAGYGASTWMDSYGSAVSPYSHSDTGSHSNNVWSHADSLAVATEQAEDAFAGNENSVQSLDDNGCYTLTGVVTSVTGSDAVTLTEQDDATLPSLGESEGMDHFDVVIMVYDDVDQYYAVWHKTLTINFPGGFPNILSSADIESPVVEDGNWSIPDVAAASRDSGFLTIIFQNLDGTLTGPIYISAHVTRATDK